MTKNLFVVNSSINLLSTFVLANSLFENDDNYLALVHPHGYDRWQEDPILRFMSSSDAGFKQVFPLIDKVFSKHVDYVRKNIKTLNVDNVFLGNDCGVQNQLLMSTLGIKEFYRLDDGLGSYYKATKRSWLRSWLHKIKFYAMAMSMGILPNFPVNTVAMGESKAAIGDCLLIPELLQRYSPQIIEITSNMIKKAMSKLMDKHLLYKEYYDGEYFIYLSESITEIKSYNFSFDKEFEYLNNKLRNLPKGTRLIYKPHPNDKPYKVEYIKKHLTDIVVNESKLPVEFLLFKEDQIKEVISVYCSALILAPKFTGRDIRCTSLADACNVNIDSKYKSMLMNMGVRMEL